MFDYIHFIDLDFKMPVTTEYREGKRLNTSESLYQNTDYEVHFSKNITDVSFTLEGDIKTLLPLPINTFTEQNLLYLQAFALNNASNNFYNERKNYNSYLLLYTYDGRGILEYDGKTHELTENYGVFIDCRKPYRYFTKDNSWLHSILHFNGNIAESFYKMFSDSGQVNFFSPIKGFYQQQLEQVLFAYQDTTPYREFEVSMLLNSLLLNIIKEKNKVAPVIPDYICQLQKFMESNFIRHLSLDDLSNHANISKYHLSREFKKYTGYSLNDYLIELRIGRAKFLLTNTSLPVYKVGQLSGFRTDINFLKVFRTKTGVTPSAYRNNI